MKLFALTPLLSQILGSGKITKAVVLTHLYLFVVAIMVNSLIYLSITRPAFETYFSSSVLDVPVEVMADEHDQVVEYEFEQFKLVDKHLEEDLLDNVSRLNERLDSLSEEVAQVPDQKEVVVREIIKVVEVPVEKVVYQSHQSISDIPTAHESQEIRQDGSMRVKDSTCDSGYAFVTPRLVRRCVE